VRLSVRILAVLATSVAVLAAGSTAGAATPIGPGQHFTGIVNGVKANPASAEAPVVFTFCPGPVGGGRTGGVLGGQSVAVTRVPGGGGSTGWFRSVNVWFVQDASAGGPQQVTLTSYDTKAEIPATVRLPCEGTGQVEFSACPRLAPCAFGWVPLLVTVRFENVAD
jgi:hypothetical protein